jgi:hypothetical protein
LTDESFGKEYGIGKYKDQGLATPRVITLNFVLSLDGCSGREGTYSQSLDQTAVDDRRKELIGITQRDE